MAIIHCTNPFAGKDAGYDPNKGGYDAKASAVHVAEAHEESWTGCVLATGEHNWHDDSDFYALVWDEEQGKVRETEYASTRGWTYHNHAKVDATPEVIAKAQAWKAQQLAEGYTAQTVQAKREEISKVDLGVEVRSTTTRGKNKDVVGTVEWIGENNYGPGMRVGVHVEGETKRRYLDMDKVERTDLPEDMAEATKLTAEEIGEISRHAAYRAQATYVSR